LFQAALVLLDRVQLCDTDRLLRSGFSLLLVVVIIFIFQPISLGLHDRFTLKIRMPWLENGLSTNQQQRTLLLPK
jgi:hypothetical protein